MFKIVSTPDLDWLTQPTKLQWGRYHKETDINKFETSSATSKEAKPFLPNITHSTKYKLFRLFTCQPLIILSYIIKTVVHITQPLLYVLVNCFDYKC